MRNKYTELAFLKLVIKEIMRTIYLTLFNFQKLSFVLLPANNTATTRDLYLYLLMIVNFYLSDFECMKNVNVSYVVTNEYELSSQK